MYRRCRVGIESDRLGLILPYGRTEFRIPYEYDVWQSQVRTRDLPHIELLIELSYSGRQTFGQLQG